jgi:hypothetical protein
MVYSRYGHRMTIIYSLQISVQATLEKTKLDPSKIDDICVGKILCALP